MRISFALEYALGHITHAENLKAALGGDSSIQPTYIDIPYDKTPLPVPWRAVPKLFNNWSLRASLVAYDGVRRRRDETDAAFFHTQVTSLLSAGLMAGIPSIVSLDATPIQIDSLGANYNHQVGAGPAEGLKKRLNERAFRTARRLITWSEWAKSSLVADYGVPAGKVTVIPPGIDLNHWRFDRRTKASGICLLFVGGDFGRKGGETLLAAFREFRKSTPGSELHVVTRTAGVGDGEPGVQVYRDLTPNSPALMELYAKADLFVFPTRGDCLPLAVMEALAAGLPVITTDVGALAEAVPHGETGLVVPVDDAAGLLAAMHDLAADPGLRARMSRAARERACERFDASKNYQKILQSLKEIAAER